MKKLLGFLLEVKKEVFERTSWPSRDEVMNMTFVVILTLVFVSMFLFGVDFLSGKAVEYIAVTKVDMFKSIIVWFLTPVWGIPWRFIGLFVLVGFLGYLFNKIKTRVGR